MNSYSPNSKQKKRDSGGLVEQERAMLGCVKYMIDRLRDAISFIRPNVTRLVAYPNGTTVQYTMSAAYIPTYFTYLR